MSQQGQQLDHLEPVPMEEPPAPNAWETETLPPDAEPATEPVPTPKWMQKRRTCVARHKCLVIFSLLFSILLGAVWILPSALDPMKKTAQQIEIERRWVDSSPYALDRACCRWFGLCGLHHLRIDRPGHSKYETDEEKRLAKPPQPEEGEDGFRSELRRRAAEAFNNINIKKKKKQPIPDYVLKHAPLVHLHWDEHFWPADLAKFLKHVHPTINGSRVDNETTYNLDNLDDLNKLKSKTTEVTLASEVDVETRPEWLFAHYGRPFANDSETSPDDHDHDEHGGKPDASGRSQSPAVLIVADKGNGTVDAFWFFFYAYNLGQTVLGARYGNHVGDWEHCMVRFQDGKPTGVFLSEHEGGLAYEYDALTKKTSSKGDERPVVYSAVGSHAMYATPGNHAYVLPFQMLKDITNDGPLWDPSLNALAYHYHSPKEDIQILGDVTPPDESESLVPAAENPDAPTGWFHYRGAWGDALFPLADSRQWRFFGQYHYVRGPFGPKWKHLGRKQLCTKKTCKILSHIDDKGTWHQ